MNRGIPERGLDPEVMATKHQHGTRTRYICGCKCFLCRRANSNYNRQRAQAVALGDWNGLVPAEKAKLHMLKLRRKGVGRRAIQAATDVAKTVLQEITTGRKTRIRARTERLILGVTVESASDGAYVSAKRTWIQIRQLQNEGFTKRDIGKRIGQSGHALQLGKKRITVRNANAINRLWLQTMKVSGTEVEL